MKTFLRFNIFQLLFMTIVGLFFQNSYAQVNISAHNVNVTTSLNGWNGSLPSGYTMTGGGDYKGTTAATAGGVYAIANAGFGYQASSGVASVTLNGTYKNTTGSTITSLQLSYKAFSIVARDSRTPGWAVTSSLGTVSTLNWTYNISNSVANPATKTITLSNLNIANNATFTLAFASDRGNGTGSSPLIGLNNVIVKSIQEITPEINTNLNTLTFDDTEIGSFSESKSVLVSSVGLTAAINITTLPMFQVSIDNTNWSNAVTLPSSGGTLYARFSPINTGGQTSNINLASTGAATKYVLIQGNALPVATTITAATNAFGPFCNSQATAFDVSFSKTGTFTNANFSVQLSNADGTFPATATNIIGTGATSPINVTIPANTTAGTNYRIRVLNAEPLTFSNDNGSNITINPTITPDFAQIPTFCSGTTAPVLAATSPNNITGTWSPATVSNTIEGSYTFTPDAGQCASPITLTTTITPLTVPDFAQIPAFCSGTTAPVLALASPNNITGTWSPATVSNTVQGSYTFTPDAGQCASPITLTTTITPLTVPDFAQIPAFCSGTTAPVLALTSPNNITGTWSPATVSNTIEGTYTFTPDAGQCASPVTLTTTITPLTIPDFAQIPAFCSGTTAPVLATSSPNGITGTWSPATVSNTIEGSYTFTPNANQCASSVTFTTTITPLTVPNFPQIPTFCSGSTAPVLATTSPNGIAGTWSPATVSNTTNGSYVFTPDANQCAATVTLTTTINTTIPPTGTATQDFTTGDTLEDFVVNGTDIKWYDAPTGGNVLPNTTVIASGTVYYASQTLNGCESPSRLPITAGIDLSNKTFQTVQLKYYPNPVDQVLNLEASKTIVAVTVFNLLGQQVLNVNPNSAAAKIDLSNLNAGTYFININAENDTKTIKVIKR